MQDPLAPAPKPTSTAPRTRRPSATDETKARDYPSFVRRRSPNPLAKEKGKNLLNERGQALKRLGLVEADVKGVPELTPKLKAAVGSIAEAISILRGDDSPDSLAFIAKWDSLSARDQANTAIEHVVTAAGLTTRRFMELLAGATFDHDSMVSKIFVSRSQLKVLQSTVKAATDEVPITAEDEDGNQVVVGHTNGDVKAQEIFLKVTGALPTPKGSSFILNQQINAQQAEIAQSQPQTPLQAMDSFLLEIDDVRKPKALNAPAAPIIPVEVPENDPNVEYLDLGEVI